METSISCIWWKPYQNILARQYMAIVLIEFKTFLVCVFINQTENLDYFVKNITADMRSLCYFWQDKNIGWNHVWIKLIRLLTPPPPPIPTHLGRQMHGLNLTEEEIWLQTRKFISQIHNKTKNSGWCSTVQLQSYAGYSICMPEEF